MPLSIDQSVESIRRLSRTLDALGVPRLGGAAPLTLDQRIQLLSNEVVLAQRALDYAGVERVSGGRALSLSQRVRLLHSMAIDAECML